MPTFLRPLRDLPPRARRWSLVLVLLCGALLGFFILRAFAWPLYRQYQLDFGAAQWIEPAEFAPVAYFRREIFLNAEPEQAWLEVAATDSFKIIINDSTVGTETSLKTRVAQIYDVKRFLKPGTNVIAISVVRNSYPGSAQLLVCGGFKEPGGKTGSFISDEQWRVTPRTGIVQGTEEWVSPLVQEQVWPNARRATITEHPVHITWVERNPLLLQLPPSGKWIVAEDARREAVFSASVNAEKARPETWIQVASSGSLDLLVNGKLITSMATSPLEEPKTPGLPRLTREPSEKEKVEMTTPPPAVVSPPQNAKPPPSPSPSASPSATATPAHSASTSGSMATSSQKPTLDAYDISYWIKKGPNTIVATVRNTQGPARFLASGFIVRKDGSIQQFETNSDWRVSDHQGAQKGRAVEAGSNGSAPWGYLTQELHSPVNLSDFDVVAKPVVVILLTIVGTIAMWLLASRFVAAKTHEALRYALARDALFHAPITGGLLFLLLPRYDFRFPIDWPFQPRFVVLAIVALLGVRLLHFVPRRRITADLSAQIRRLKNAVSAEALPYLLLAMIIGLGFAFRYHDFGVMSFDHDEYGEVQKSKGIWELGFPFNRVTGRIRPATTYELIPYPMAVTSRLFGESEWSIRLPAVIMGTLCIGIIALMGRRLFNWRTGLIAAFIYACLPLDIRWAQNAFHPQQCQFMAMLTFWFFYEGIRVRPFCHKYLTAATVTFCASYLSWEGSAFILPALFLALLVVRWGEWWWLKEFHLYRCVFFMATLVIAQFSWRTLVSLPYLQIGTGVNDLAGPSLFFLKYGWRPMFYVDHLLLAENHVFFTLMTVAGIPFCWRQPAFRYVVTLIGALLFCHTNLIAALSTRYCIYYQPLLILSGVAAAVMLYDRLLLFAERESNSTVARSFAHTTGVAMLFLLFVQSNEWLMKLYSLSSPNASPALMTRLNTYRYDHRGAAEYVRSHLQPGDIIIAGIPHVFEHYAGIRGDYFLDTILMKKIIYNAKFAEPRFMDRFRGYAAIRSLKELREAISRGRRTWIVFVPYGGFGHLSSPEARVYLNEHAKVVFESYRGKVLLIGGENQSVNPTAGYNAK
ncbi:MAG TPA: glycosyltransferase family 39 protein [Methylomirabilota bacterium]|nr:glycosyltransferase family 39 protein [Methylomirabilota bacterium]